VLATSPPVFAYYSSNYASTPTTSVGTGFTAGANRADGTAVSCIAALAHDVHLIRIHLWGISGSTADSNAAGDLLIDPGGATSWTPLINDLVCGFGQTLPNAANGLYYEFPLWIPAGASVGWQCKTAHTADITNGRILIELFGEPSRPEMLWCGTGVESIGIADAKGTAITAGDTGVWGTWTSIGSTTAHHIKAIQLGVNGGDASVSAREYHFQIGAGSQPLPGSGIAWANTSSSEVGAKVAPGLTYCNLPSGTQLQARATCSSTALDPWHVAAYGVY
jgi:hypothetical protein